MNKELLKKIFTILNTGALGITYYTFDESKFKDPQNSAETIGKYVNSTSTSSGESVEVSKTSNTGLSDKQTLDSNNASVTSITALARENQLTPEQESALNKIESNSLNSNLKLTNKLNSINNKLEEKSKLDEEYQTTTIEAKSLFTEDQKKELAEKVRTSKKLNSEINEEFKKVIDYLKSDGKSGSLDFINMENIYKIFSAYQDFLHSLTPEQFYGVLHIVTGSFILMCMFNIISAQFGIFIINYFKITEKYPKLAKIIELRNKFQRYYFIFNCIMIILATCMMIVTNIIVILF